jgi:hypothetical protein
VGFSPKLLVSKTNEPQSGGRGVPFLRRGRFEGREAKEEETKSLIPISVAIILISRI